MSKFLIALAAALLFVATPRTWADAPAVPPANTIGFGHYGPGVTAITGTLDKPENTDKIAALLGHHGVHFIRSEARWDEFCKLLPNLAPDTPLPKLDFATQNIVLVYTTDCRNQDTLQLSGPDLPNGGLAPQTSQTDCFLRWDNGPEDQKEFRYAKFLLVVVPTIPTMRVFVLSSPLVTRPNRPPALDFEAWFGDKAAGAIAGGGDIVDSLQATITPQAATIKPGEDILIDVQLHFAKMRPTHPERFGTAPKNLFVWDGTYSNGYRNHAFFITTPDGKTTLLRPAEHLFKKNVPHPVELTANTPYTLPGDVDATHKSLKTLGLDTSAPGTYTITALYEESASTEDKKPMWGGSIASNTITVEVKK